jgi:hypothetical protein
LTYKETIGTERIVVDVTLGKLGNFECPALYDLYELDAQELLNMIEGRRGTNNEILYWYLQMSQTLRYAVKNDFRRGINPQTWSIIGATTGIIALLVTIVDRFMV